jgi:hypothetical protein
LLQVSANLYDATTTNELPSVFRPFFRNYGTNIVIVGYGAVTNLEVLSATNRDLAVPSERASLQANDLVYGIPLVIGAKKGLPNFNEFALQTFVQATRKLQFVKASVGAKPFQTNQMFILGISNVFGVEAWNSYRLPYPRPLQLQVGVDLTGVLTNETGILWSNRLGRGVISNILAGTWPGAAVNAANRTYLANETNSLKVPLQTGYWFLTNSAYLQKSTGGGVIGNLNPAFAVKGAGFPIPILGLTLTARLRFVLVDAQFTPNRIVDYVNLADLTSYLDITSELAGPDPTGQDISVALWDTNRVGNSASVMAPTRGIMQQISISMGGAAADSIWTDYNATTVDKAKSIAAFSAFLLASPSSTELVKQTPFNPVRLFSLQNTWQANDPLVHYQPGDLADLVKGTNDVQFYLRTAAPNVLANLGRLNQRCNPWGGNPDTSTKTDPYNLALKDPQVRRSDDWEFPASKFPSLGWLGRVHRGTPWQTVYMKSPDLATTPLAGKPTAWQTWSGNRNLGDANYARPIADRALFEHFSTALSPNSTRGQLSVNNDNLAAWSAVLACVCVLSNNVPDAKFNDPYQLPQFSAEFIKPAGEEGWNSALGAIVQGIHRTRTNATLFPRQVFSTLGQILAVPELTTNSPFLNTNTIQLARGITDAAYERIPQQILSLLRGDDDPRFVIYAFGQALRPAENSLVQAGPLIRLCTNYAVTAESASRTVVRIVDAPTPAYPNRKPRVLVESFNYLPTD